MAWPTSGTSELRELLTRFNVPFRFHAAGSEEGRRLLKNRGLSAACLPVVIRHDDYTMVQPTPARSSNRSARVPRQAGQHCYLDNDTA